MIPFISSEQLKTVLPFPALIDALRTAFQQEDMTVPKRHVHALPVENASLLLMPVWQAKQQMGVKLATVVPGNRQSGKSTVQSLFILQDTQSGTPLAIMDGEQLTLRRTAAASALASTYLSRANSRRLLIIGTGQLAPYMALAHCAVRPIEQVSVWGRTPEKVEQTLLAIRAAGLPEQIKLVAAGDLHEALISVDIVSAVTTSQTPLIHAASVCPGTHVDLVGGFRPDMREADDELMSQASIFVDTFDGALSEAGDLLQPIAAGLITADSVQGELADLACGRHAGRINSWQVTVFKSVGTALEDLAAANLAWTALQGTL